VKPKKNFAIYLWDNIIKGATSPTGSSDKTYLYYAMTIILLLVFVAAILMKQRTKLDISQIEKDSAQFKHTLVSNINLDFHGQGVINKLEHSVFYSENPLRHLSENDIASLKVLNKQLDTQEKEDLSLSLTLVKDRKINKTLKSQLSIKAGIKKMDRKISVEKPLAKDEENEILISTKKDDKKNRKYRKMNMTNMLTNGCSFYGAKTICVLDY